MKQLLVAFATVAAITAIGAGGVSANNPDAGEIVASGFKCTIYDGTGHTFATLDSVLILYQRKAVLRCVGDGVGARPAGPIYFNHDNKPALCGLRPYGFTTNWSDKVGYNGNSQLTCTQVFTNSSIDDAGEDAGIVE